MLSSDDYGKDLASVNALLRKHEALERDLAAVEDKVMLWREDVKNNVHQDLSHFCKVHCSL